MGDFNLALVIVAVVVSVLVLLVSVYLLVNYQHPDDANQAYFPKLVVVLGITVAVLSILMLPANVANRQACRRAVYNGASTVPGLLLPKTRPLLKGFLFVGGRGEEDRAVSIGRGKAVLSMVPRSGH
jgi:hypothetical protein